MVEFQTIDGLHAGAIDGRHYMKITQDPIVREVRRQRDKLSAKFNYDLHAIVADIQVRQRGNSRLVTRKKKRSSRDL